MCGIKRYIYLVTSSRQCKAMSVDGLRVHFSSAAHSEYLKNKGSKLHTNTRNSAVSDMMVIY